MTIHSAAKLCVSVIAVLVLSSCAAKQPTVTNKTPPKASPVIEQPPGPAQEKTSPQINTPEEKPVNPPDPVRSVVPETTEAANVVTAAKPSPKPLTGPKSEGLAIKPNTPPTATQPNLPHPLNIQSTQKTGNLRNTDLTEVSGFSASKDWPGVIYAINDSGNAANLYALSESGGHLGQWSIEGRNRDWEDLASTNLDGQNYIVIGDTGDNLNIHKTNTLYFIPEPIPGSNASGSIKPHMTVKFVYEDGPRNVEAFAIHDKTMYLISKEAISAAGPQASRLYSLDLPGTQPVNNLTARFLATLPIQRQSLEAKLAASFAGVDLNHPTALDIDPNGRTAYLLSYRQVRRYERLPQQSWADAFQTPGTRIHFHQLGQAEALALAAGRALFITSENRAAPIWAIPVKSYQ